MSPKTQHKLTVDTIAANCDRFSTPCEPSPASGDSSGNSGKKAAKSLRSKASFMKLLNIKSSESKSSIASRSDSQASSYIDSPIELDEQASPVPRTTRHIRQQPLYSPASPATISDTTLTPTESSGDTITPRTFRLRKRSQFNLLSGNPGGTNSPYGCYPTVKQGSEGERSAQLHVEVPQTYFGIISNPSSRSGSGHLVSPVTEGASFLTPLSNTSWASVSHQSSSSFASAEPQTPSSFQSIPAMNVSETSMGNTDSKRTSPTHVAADSTSSDHGNSFECYANSNATFSSFVTVSEGEIMAEEERHRHAEEERRRSDRFLAYIELKVSWSPLNTKRHTLICNFSVLHFAMRRVQACTTIPLTIQDI